MQHISTQRKRAKRFSLLLLEEGEHYVADWTAMATWPSNIQGNWQNLPMLPGRLRLASRSLFFEADDARVPIVRIPFSAAQQMEAVDGTSFTIVVTSVTKMKPNAADVPYVTEKGKASRWDFKLPYSNMDAFMPLANEQLAAGRLSDAERDAYFEAAEQRRVDAATFDSSRLVDFRERIRCDIAAVLISPLVRESGRFVVTDQRIYFQPIHNILGDVVVYTHPLSAVAAVAKRLCCLRPLGMEVFLVDPGARAPGPTWDTPCAFFSFRNEHERTRCYETLMQQAALGSGIAGGGAALRDAAGVLEGSGEWLPRVTRAWRHGQLSNFDYLLFCNLAAGRSFNDLAQWPVIPWVLRDFTSAVLDLHDASSFRDLSKPIGALTPTRLDMFRARFRDMPEEFGPRFMYGTHYSTPGYVMFWLVRAAPAHMLRLQAGKFDAADRLFCSIADAWASVTSNPADVKELIPEFYLPNTDFLVNKENLALGQRQNGRMVGDVDLPPWSNNSPSHFLALMRCALESPYVSANLHHWIDLVFGVNQRGDAAVDADNVFHPLTYHGAVDIDKITDPVERAAVEAQVNEFGQCPRQIFTQPHPQRAVCPPPPDPSTVFAGVDLQRQHAGVDIKQQHAGVDRQHHHQGSTTNPGSMLSLALLSVIGAAAEAVQNAEVSHANDSVDDDLSADSETLLRLQQLDVKRGCGDHTNSDIPNAVVDTSRSADDTQETQQNNNRPQGHSTGSIGKTNTAHANNGNCIETHHAASHRKVTSRGQAQHTHPSAAPTKPLPQPPANTQPSSANTQPSPSSTPTATGGWGLPTGEAFTRARGGVQGLRSWSSKRLGQLGTSLAETVETVKVKGADVARGAMTRYPSGGAAAGGSPVARGPLVALRGVPRQQEGLGLTSDDFEESPEELMGGGGAGHRRA